VGLIAIDTSGSHYHVGCCHIIHNFFFFSVQYSWSSTIFQFSPVIIRYGPGVDLTAMWAAATSFIIFFFSVQYWWSSTIFQFSPVIFRYGPRVSLEAQSVSSIRSGPQPISQPNTKSHQLRSQAQHRCSLPVASSTARSTASPAPSRTRQQRPIQQPTNESHQVAKITGK
jgi:hypothetical protein